MKKTKSIYFLLDSRIINLLHAFFLKNITEICFKNLF